MKKNIFLLPVTLFLIIILSCSEEESPVSNPTPPIADTTEFSNITSRLPGWAFDYELHDIELIGNRMWLSMANDHYILISQDAGLTFSKIDTKGHTVPHMHFLPNGLTGYLCGNRVLKTTDGGFSWDSLNINLKYIYAIQFLNPNLGFLIGSTDTAKYLVTTTNGGNNWSYRNIMLGHSSTVMTSLCVPDTLNPDRIYIGTDRGLFLSSNSGASWQKIPFPPGDPHVIRLVYWKRNSFLMCGKNGILYTNINNSWLGHSTNTVDIITDVHCSYSGGLLIAPASDKFYVYMSQDSGKTLKQKEFGRNVTGSLNGVKVIGDSLAYLVGHRSLFFMYKRK